MENISTSHNRPVIGVSGRVASSPYVQATMAQVRAAGGVPVFFGNHKHRKPEDDINLIDGIVFAGNPYDIHVEGDNNPNSEIKNHPERAEYEKALMKLALENNMPILGICGGMQRLNEVCDGHMHKNGDAGIDREIHDMNKEVLAPFTPVHLVHLEGETRLAEIGANIPKFYTPDGDPLSFAENSIHRQAISTVGQGLKIAAHGDDIIGGYQRLIEAIEIDNDDPHSPYKNHPFAIGVQWHPEFAPSELDVALFDELVGEAKKFAHKNQKTHTANEILKANIQSTVDPSAVDSTYKKVAGYLGIS